MYTVDDEKCVCSIGTRMKGLCEDHRSRSCGTVEAGVHRLPASLQLPPASAAGRRAWEG